jgi:transcriptional regulator with XRE-family HTH domain
LTENNLKDVGDELRLKRLEKRYTLEQTAKLVGVSTNYISKLEKAETPNPSDEVIVGLAKALDMDENSLFKSFGRLPLATRETLKALPHLADHIAEVSSDDTLDISEKEELIEKLIHWRKVISERRNKKSRKE